VRMAGLKSAFRSRLESLREALAERDEVLVAGVITSNRGTYLLDSEGQLHRGALAGPARVEPDGHIEVRLCVGGEKSG